MVCFIFTLITKYFFTFHIIFNAFKKLQYTPIKTNIKPLCLNIDKEDIPALGFAGIKEKND